MQDLLEVVPLLVTTCPNCAKSVQLPDELLGGQAVCPYCKSLFIAPTKLADGTFTAPKLSITNPFTRSRAFAPGIMLIFIAAMSMLWNTVRLVEDAMNPEDFRRRTAEDIGRMTETIKKSELKDKDVEDPAVKAELDQKLAVMDDKVDMTLRWLPRIRMVSIALSILSLIGGIGMIRQRWHTMGMLGCAVAMFNVANLCCIAGLPVGAWGLFVLMNPKTAIEFHEVSLAADKPKPN